MVTPASNHWNKANHRQCGKNKDTTERKITYKTNPCMVGTGFLTGTISAPGLSKIPKRANNHNPHMTNTTINNPIHNHSIHT